MKVRFARLCGPCRNQISLERKALNLVRPVKESSIPSIRREFSAGADDLDAYGEAFVSTLVRL